MRKWICGALLGFGLSIPAFANVLKIVEGGSTDVTVFVKIIDSTDGTPETGVVFDTSGIDLEYCREYAACTDITEADLTTPALTDSHEDGGFLATGHGGYRLDLPDAAVAAGVRSVVIQGTVTGMIVIGGTVEISPPVDLVANAVDATSVATAAIDADAIATDAIGAAELADNAIDAGAIATDAITATKIAADAIGASELATAAIGAAEIATDAIGAAEIAADAIGASELAANAIGAAELANAAIDAATFAADVDAEVLSYLVDDATQIDASALNTASGTSIPDILTDTGTTIPATITTLDTLLDILVFQNTTIGDTSNDTTHVHLETLTYGDDEINGYFLMIYDDSETEWHWREIEDWVNSTALATVSTLPFTPEDDTDLYALVATLGAADVTGGDATAANQTTLINALGTIQDLGSGATVAFNLVDIEGQTDDIGAAGVGLTESGGTGDQFTALDVFSISGDSTAADTLEAILDLQTGSNGAFPMFGILATGTAQTYTAGTPSVTLAASTAAGDDDFNGATILVVGSNEGDWQSAVVSDYAGATDIATIDAAFSTAPSGTISYIVFGTAEGSGSGATASEVWNFGTRILTALDEDNTTVDLNGTTVGAVGTVSSLGTDAITATSIAADAIGASEIAANAIGASEIATDAIGAAEIAASAIGAAEIADGAIDAATFASGAIDATAIAADAIGASELATDAIGAAEIAANAITASEVADGAIDDGALDDDALGDGTTLTEAGGDGDHLTEAGGTGDQLTALPNVDVLASGACDSGSTTTCVDGARTESDNDYWRGVAILFTSGTMDGQSRCVVDFVAATDTLTWVPATTQAVDTDSYQLIRDTNCIGVDPTYTP